MTDTVIVPREPTPEMLNAGANPNYPCDAIDVWRAMLAAAPKAEPVSELKSDIAHDRSYLNGLREGWNMGQTDDYERYERIVSARIAQITEANAELRAQPEAPKADNNALSSKSVDDRISHDTELKPEAPKVNQEPCYECGSDVFITSSSIDRACAICNPDLNPAPASDELLEALKPFADAAEDLDEAETGHIWERPAAMNIDASDLRRAYELYSKHKGPQS